MGTLLRGLFTATLCLQPALSFCTFRPARHSPKLFAWGDPQTIADGAATASSSSHHRRKKKNKYEKLSKVGNADPMEVLLAESEQKNRALAEEKVNTEKKIKTEIAPLPALEFPDTKEIDPYDPQTFGYIEIASIVGPHGVHGWLKVRCTSDFPLERLCTAGIRHLKLAKKRAPRQITLLDGKHRHGDEYLVQLDGIDSRDAAQSLRGALLYVREEQKDCAAVTEQDEYLVSDLIGLEVFLETDGTGDDKSFVGTVGGVVFADEVCSTPGLGHDYVEVILPRGLGGTASFRDEMVLIPMVPQIVPRVDIQGQAIFIDPPTGLLDLTYVRSEKTRIKGFLPSADSG